MASGYCRILLLFQARKTVHCGYALGPYSLGSMVTFIIPCKKDQETYCIHFPSAASFLLCWWMCERRNRRNIQLVSDRTVAQWYMQALVLLLCTVPQNRGAVSQISKATGAIPSWRRHEWYWENCVLICRRLFKVQAHITPFNDMNQNVGFKKCFWEKVVTSRL